MTAADPAGALGEPSDDMAVARRMPTAALVAVLAERGAPGDVSAKDLSDVERLNRLSTKGPFRVNRHECDGGAINWQVQQDHGSDGCEVVANITDDEPKRARYDAAFYALARTLLPRLAREVVILRALAVHKLPCGHALGDIVYGGLDLNGLPAVAQCGQCLADRQKAKAALPRTPETVLQASVARLRNAINNPPDGDDDTWKRAMRAALREHEATIAGTRPLGAPPMEAP